ncbi:MAG TPA: restriction endonuclease subunit S [Spirochaetia bacterium]|nr:restriction endonuclease subunit S [Spirochaetia bacterium]
MKFKPYSKYVDSGVEWLGEIPEGWQKQCVKFATTIELSNVDKHAVEGEPDVFLCNYTDVYTNSVLTNKIDYMKATATLEQINRLRLSEGDVVITKDSETPNDIGIPSLVIDTQSNLVCGYHLAVLRPNVNHLIGGYLVWFYRSKNAKSYFETEAVGMTRYGLGKHSIATHRIPIPPLPVQRKITSFLNSSTARIDSLVHDYEELIALLQEKRQALISHAVTRGLSELVRSDDPDYGEWAKPVKFVDSGVEWLGEIPEGWMVNRISRLYFERNEVGSPELPILSVSIHAGVSDKELDEKEMDRKVTRSEDREKYKKVVVNDLTYNMMRAWQGGFGAVSTNGMVSPAYVVARPKTNLDSRYFEDILRSPNAIEQMRVLSRGVIDFRLRLYWDEFKTICVPCPSVAEQKAILDYVSRETVKIDALVKETQDAIELLKEHRAALITNAVTGKINVEDWAEA